MDDIGELNEPFLGLATTRELLEEIKARAETHSEYKGLGELMVVCTSNLLYELPDSILDYRTVDSY